MININRLNQNNNYSLEKPNIPTKRSTLIMRETNQTTGDVGKIIPFFVHEMLPSETFKANTMAELQFTPFVTNLVHEMKGEIRTYFVPYRIIWDKWERFITGCDEENDQVDGTIMEELPKISAFMLYNALVRNIRKKFLSIPEEEREAAFYNEAEILENEMKEYVKKHGNWTYSSSSTIKLSGLLRIMTNLTEEQLKKPLFTRNEELELNGEATGGDGSDPLIARIKAIGEAYKKYLVGTNYDYYGLPIQAEWIAWMNEEVKTTQQTVLNVGQYTRERTTQQIYIDYKTEIDTIINKIVTVGRPIALNFWAYNKIYNDWIRQMDWEPRANKENLSTLWGNYENDIYTRARRYQLRGAMPTVPVNIGESLEINGSLNHLWNTPTHGVPGGENLGINNANGTAHIGNATSGYNTLQNHELNNVEATINSQNSSWNILDMTTPAGILNYYLANARIKPRYAEQLLARWGVTIQDARFQYAQFVDSTRINITQNGVTQTSPQAGESTAQGNITGQAWGNGDGNIRFYAPEHGVLISYIQITPANAYENGMKREYLKKTKFDYPTPELVDTPDVPLYKSELVINSVDNVEENELGYIAIYDEYRTKTNRVTGLLRPSIKGSLGAKTLARYFEDDVNMETLIKCKPDMERVKQFTTQPDFILYTQTSIKTSLPLPYINDPRIMI